VHTAIIVMIILGCAAGCGYGFFAGCKKAIAKFESLDAERRANNAQREAAARRARMTRFSMNQFSGTKASDRNW
jgi:flagellar basal body-associated protein FliL